MIIDGQFSVTLAKIRGDFNPDLVFVRKQEGGNDDDPHDPGGRTSRGIEQTEYDAWCRIFKEPTGDVFKASDGAIDAIYYYQFWLPFTPYVPTAVDLVFFDTHVNEGLGPAVEFLQRSLEITADGKFGLVTRAACAAITDPAAIIRDMTAQRVSAYRGMRQFKRYGKGWLARAAACQTAALAMLPASSVKT